MRQVIIPIPDQASRVESALRREQVEHIMKSNKSVASFFVDGLQGDKLARVLRSASRSMLLLLSQPIQHGDRFSFMELKGMLGLPKPLNLYFRGMEVTSYSPGWGGSSATYLGTFKLDTPEKKVRLYLQLLQASSKTSKHYHKIITETYVSLVGEGVTVGDRSLSDSLFLEVPPGIGNFHQVRTGQSPALTLLCMDPKLGPKEDYYYDQPKDDEPK